MLYRLAAPLALAAACGAASEDFFRAIRANDLAAVRAMSKDKTSVNAADARKVTPLLYAALYGSPEAVKVLLAAGAEPNAASDIGLTPLIAGACNTEKAQALAAAGADVNAASKSGRTPLIVAASCPGSHETLKLLLGKGANPNAADQFGNTALIQAAGQSGLANVKLLLGSGAQAAAKTKAGDSALLAAAGRGDAAMAKLLIAAGADVNAANTQGGKVRHGDIALAKLTPLMLASTHGGPDIVKTLLAAGARVNDRDVRGMTPVAFAVSSETQNPEVAGLLIKAGADLKVKDSMGDTPLDWARKFGDPAVMKALESAGGVAHAVPPPPARTKAPNAPGPAIGQAMALVGKSSAEFFNLSGCVACHHQVIATRAWGAAYRAGAIRDETPGKMYAGGLVAARPVFEPGAMQMIGPPGDLDTIQHTMFAAVDANAPASPLTDATAHFIANRQFEDGHWDMGFGGISRAPLEESNISRTMMGVRILKAYAWQARQAEFEERIARARKWLAAQSSKTSYEAADQLLGLHYAGAPASELAAVAKKLATMQNDDGGWSQNARLKSDAYATGLALHALFETKQAKPTDALYKKGVDYLLRTQLDDGTWYVRSRAPKFQPYFQSGFPHDHDQWISIAATAMAVMGLAPAAI